MHQDLHFVKKLKAYTQSGPTWTRVELLVVAFDGVLSRLEQARGLIEANNRSAAEPLLLRSQRIVMELYSGTDIQHGKIPENMQKLYLFVLSCIGLGRELDLTAALDILRNIRGGLESIRGKAAELERSGELSPVCEQMQILKHVVA